MWKRVVRLHVAGEPVDVAELARPQAGQVGGAAGDRRTAVGLVQIGQQVMLEPLRIGAPTRWSPRSSHASQVAASQSRATLSGTLRRSCHAQWREPELLTRLRRDELERVRLVVAREGGALGAELADRQAELKRIAAGGLADVGDPQADVIDLSQPDHVRLPVEMIDRR